MVRVRHVFRACGIAAIAVLLQAGLFNLSLVPIDEGQIASFATRILRGEVIYRDFYTGIFPGSYYLAALVFKTFGQDLLVLRLLQVMINVAITVLLFELARQVASTRWAAAWALSYLAVVALSFPTLTMFSYSGASLAAGLFALLFVLRFYETTSRSNLLLAGLCIALSGLMKQNYGAFAAVAVTFSFAVAFLADSLPRRKLARGWILLCAAAMAPAALVLVFVVLSGAGSNFYRYTVETLWTTQMQAFHQPIPPIFNPAPDQSGTFLFFYLPNALFGYVLRGESFGGISLHEHTRWAIIRASYGGVLFLLGVAWLHAIAARPRYSRREWLSRISIIAFAQFLFLGLFPSAIWSHLAAVIPPVLIIGAMLCDSAERALTYRVPFVRHAGLVTVGGILALIGFVSVRITLDARRWYPELLGLARATLRVAPEQAEGFRESVRFLTSCARPNEPVFVAPDLPVLYFLSMRRNATPYEMLIPGDIQEPTLIRSLEQSRTRCVLYNPQMYPHFQPLDAWLPTFASYLDTHYEVVKTIDVHGQQWQCRVRRVDN